MEKVKFAQKKVRRDQGSPVELLGASLQQEEGRGHRGHRRKHGGDKVQGY